MSDYDKTSLKRHYDRTLNVKIPHFHNEIRRPSITPIYMIDVNLDPYISHLDNPPKHTNKVFVLSDIVKKYKDKLKKFPSGAQSPTLAKDRMSYDLSYRNSHNLTQFRGPCGYLKHLASKLTSSPDPHKIPLKKIPKLEPLRAKSPKSLHPSPKVKPSAKDKMRNFIDSYNNTQANNIHPSEVSKKLIMLSADEHHTIHLKGNKIRKSNKAHKTNYVREGVFQDSLVKNTKMVDKEVFIESDDVWSSLSSW